jgi:uncharacterized membrane protein
VSTIGCGILMKNKHCFVLALIGGVILFIQGVTGSIGFFSYLPMLLDIPELAPLGPVITYIIYIVGIIAASGGIGAIAGGYLLTTSRVGTGRFIIGIAVGMSLVGIIIGLIQVVWLSGVTAIWDALTILSQTAGIVGIVLTIIARRTARTD